MFQVICSLKDFSNKRQSHATRSLMPYSNPSAQRQRKVNPTDSYRLQTVSLRQPERSRWAKWQLNFDLIIFICHLMQVSRHPGEESSLCWWVRKSQCPLICLSAPQHSAAQPSPCHLRPAKQAAAVLYHWGGLERCADVFHIISNPIKQELMCTWSPASFDRPSCSIFSDKHINKWLQNNLNWSEAFWLISSGSKVTAHS